MSIQRYEIFNKVVQTLSITKAGEALNITQSGISHAIKSLEKELDIHLFIRNRNGVHLTREGERLYKYSLNVVNAHRHLLEEASALAGVETGVLNIGTFASVSTHWLPKMIREFENKHPDISINIFENDYDSLEAGVETGELDCCFTVQSKKKTINFVPLLKDELYCIVSLENPLSVQDRIRLEQLEQYPLIKPKEGWDQEIYDLFVRNQIKPIVKYEISDDNSIISMVKENLGINIRPGLVLTNAPEGIRAIKLEAEAYRLIGVGVTDRPSHAARKFLSIARDFVSATV